MFTKPVLFLLLLSLPLYFFTVNHWSFNDADEPFYAQMSKEMVQNGDWLTLHYEGTPWFGKPPLVFWLVAVSYKIFGVNEFSARLPIIILAIMSVFLIYFLAQELFHNFYTSLFSSIIFLTTYHFIYLGHLVMMDVPTVFFILLGLYGLLRSAVKKEWAILYGLSLSLAILSKGVLGAVLVICIIPYIVLQKKFSFLRNPYLWIGIIAGMVLSGSWYFYQIHVHGDNFLKVHFWQHVIQRSRTEICGIDKLGIFFYPVQVLANFFPWSIILPLSLFRNIKGFLKKSESDTFILGWVVAYFIIITTMRTKLPHYSLPLYPFFAFSVGQFMSKIRLEEKKLKILKIINWIYIGFSIAFFIIATIVAMKAEFYIYRRYILITIITAAFFLLVALFYLFAENAKRARNANKSWVILLPVATYIVLTIAILNLRIWDFNPDVKKLASLNTEKKVYCIIPSERPDVYYPVKFYFGSSREPTVGNFLISGGNEESIKAIWKDKNDIAVLMKQNTASQKDFIPNKILAMSGEWVLIRKE